MQNMDIQLLKKQIADLRAELLCKELLLSELLNIKDPSKLSNEEIARYSRQIILNEIGVKGQLALKNSSVLVIGAGGLGCPVCINLAGAGVGHIGIVDYDKVETNNLHRQLLHTENSVGIAKVESIRVAINSLNSNILVSTYNEQLTSKNALDTIKMYDIVVDATDNVATRYLLNDACVLLNKPLVSGSALQLEGQLTIYNYQNGPCYRCLFPKPPPASTVKNCGDSGVIGAVTGVIGALQALEAIKIVLGNEHVFKERFLLFDGLTCSFRTFKLRNRRANCDICGDTPSLTKLIDYEQFCGMAATDKDNALRILKSGQRITVKDYKILMNQVKHLLVDVRSVNEFEICQLPSSVNVPIKTIIDNKIDESVLKMMQNLPVYVVCRRGNDSQIAVEHLNKSFKIQSKDLIGGLHAWTKTIDSSFPIY